MLDPGVARQQVKLPELGDHIVDERLGLSRIADVSLKRHGATVGADDLFDQGVGRRGVGSVVDGHSRALGRQPTGHGRTDSPATAGDEGDLAAQSSTRVL